jgi:pimeloyl-ACP methyl ester carboxylesterase
VSGRDNEEIPVTQRMIDVNGVKLCTESFGKPGNPTLLLIMGATASMVQWAEEFCSNLAGRGLYVIRYDNRDTGGSTTYPPGEPGYKFSDMVADAEAVLDEYEIDAAHVAGLSLGGMIGEVLTLRRPQRVRSLTLISTSPQGPEEPDLPEIAPEIFEFVMGSGTLDWSDHEAVRAYKLELMSRLAGSGRPVDREFLARQIDRELEHCPNLASQINHALVETDIRWREELAEIAVPTLVIHGDEDPVLPYPHGLALAKEIPGATLLTLEGTGHELPPEVWPVVVDAIAELTVPKD